MGPANMKRYQLFLLESIEWFPQKNTMTYLKNGSWTKDTNLINGPKFF